MQRLCCSLCAPQRVWVPFVIVDSEDHIKQLMNKWIYQFILTEENQLGLKFQFSVHCIMLDFLLNNYTVGVGCLWHYADILFSIASWPLMQLHCAVCSNDFTLEWVLFKAFFICCNSSSFLTSIRNRPPSSACASPSSSPSMRRSGWSRSWPSAASTHTTSSSTNLFSPTQRGRVKCVKPAIKFSPSI